jgi:hypothetical protein
MVRARKSWLISAALTLGLCASLVHVRPANAWTDSRPAGLVTEVVVDRDGGATVTVRVRWRVLAGHFHSFDLSEIPPDATVVEATATDAQNSPVAVSTRTTRAGQLEVTLGERDGLRRGTVDVVLRYTTSLRAQGAIVREGPDAVVHVATVPWERGLEAAELRVATPSSIQRARWISDDTPGVETHVSSEVGRDVVRAVRRHLPAGSRWEARIACDHALFTWLNTEQAAPRTQARVTSHQRWTRPLLWVLCALTFAASTEAVRRRSRQRNTLISFGKNLAFVPAVLAACGGVLMALVLDSVRGALTAGTLLILASTLAVAPSLRPLKPAPSDARPRAVSPSTLRDLVRNAPRSHALLAFGTVAWLGVIATALAFIWRIPALSLAGSASVLLALAGVIATRPREPNCEALTLVPLADAIATLDVAARTQVAWRLRGNLQQPSSLRMKLIARRGFRSTRGLKSIELAVRWEPSWLRWEAHPVLTVRARTGERLEKSLRIAGARVGQTVLSEDGAQLAWTVAWSGLEKSIARSLLQSILSEAFAPAKHTRSLSDRASRETAEEASQPCAQPPARSLL